jgi:hypothetical protein
VLNAVDVRDASVWDLFRALYDRIWRGLVVRHVDRGEFGWRIADAGHVVSRITWDPERAGEVPLLVIDGRPFTWDPVGRMLMSFEGFTPDSGLERLTASTGTSRAGSRLTSEVR